MAQWGKDSNSAANSVSWAAESLSQGSGKVAIAANNTTLYNNTTAGAWVDANVAFRQAVGQFGANPVEMAITTGEGPKVRSAGWQLRRAGMGPITGATGANGSGFANGETVLVSGGMVNATLVITANATNNLASVAVSGNGGAFTNASSLTFTFQREQHIANVRVTSGTGYNNTDYIVVSNGTVNALATFVTNAAGTFGNSDITLTNLGIFAAAKTTGQLVINVYAANGAASNGTGGSFTGTFGNSTGGVISLVKFGGRANRVTYECLVAMSSTSNGNVAFLPRT